jgi:hypothetical protein
VLVVLAPQTQMQAVSLVALVWLAVTVAQPQWRQTARLVLVAVLAVTQAQSPLVSASQLVSLVYPPLSVLVEQTVVTQAVAQTLVTVAQVGLARLVAETVAQAVQVSSM